MQTNSIGARELIEIGRVYRNDDPPIRVPNRAGRRAEAKEQRRRDRRTAQLRAR